MVGLVLPSGGPPVVRLGTIYPQVVSPVALKKVSCIQVVNVVWPGDRWIFARW